MNNKQSMALLKKNIGKIIKVFSVFYGQPEIREKKLKGVDDFTNILIEGTGIPFVGYGSAIQRILDENGETPYYNHSIHNDYDLRDDKEIDIIRELSFGKRIATQFRKQRETEKKKWEIKKVRLNEEAKSKASNFIKEGKNLVKPKLKEEWKKYSTKNTKDFYSAGVVEASLRIMVALAEGKTSEEAEKTANGMGITGFQMGCVAQTVSYFHPRGEEFRKYWNMQYLPKKKAKKIKGVINPAILTISTKK